MIKKTLFSKTACASLGLIAMLLGCGGGGSGSSANDTASNPYVAAAGKYTSGCWQTNQSPPRSTSVTLVISSPVGPDKAAASYQSQEYSNNSCLSSGLTSDITVVGTLKAMAATKFISLDNARFGSNSITGTASTAGFSLEQLTFTKSNYTLPGIGATTNVGYMFQDSKLYVLLDPRGEPDQLGRYFATIYMTKQP